MPAISPYLHFNGNTEEAFNFYKSVFGNDFMVMQRYKDAPSENQMGETDGNKIMHVSLPIGEGTLLMGSDIPQGYGPAVIGTNVYISINTVSREETDKIFNGLSAEGQVLMPLEHTFWGAYFGMFKDRFGVQWMVNCDEKQ